MCCNTVGPQRATIRHRLGRQFVCGTRWLQVGEVHHERVACHTHRSMTIGKSDQAVVDASPLSSCTEFVCPHQLRTLSAPWPWYEPRTNASLDAILLVSSDVGGFASTQTLRIQRSSPRRGSNALVHGQLPHLSAVSWMTTTSSPRSTDADKVECLLSGFASLLCV